MYFQQLLDQQHGCASYLIASRQTRDAAIVDPSIKIEQYERLLRDRDLRLRYVIDTHIHADHVSGARLLADAHHAELCLHASAQVTYPFRPLADGEEFALGQLRLRALHTPGHRPELISLLITNLDRSPEPSMALTGDSLLVGDVGRPDFGGGDASAQYASITRLLTLPDWVEVFPGHFEGPCGKSMCGRPSTTIGFERRFSPLLALERDEFITTLTNDIPARPLNMTTIEATNRGLADDAWAMLTSAPTITQITIDELDARLGDSVLLDVREPREYQRGHIPGAINLPQADLASRLGELPRDTPMFIVCQTGSRSRRVAEFLRQMGFVDVANVVGGTSAWRKAHKPLTQDTPAAQRVISAAASDPHPFALLLRGEGI